MPNPLKLPEAIQPPEEIALAHEAISDAMEQGLEPPPEALATIQSYALSAAEKRDAVVWVMHEREARVAAIEGEMACYQAILEALRMHRNALENANKRVSQFICDLMRARDCKKLVGVAYSFTVQKNPPAVDSESLELCNMDDWPDFVRVERDWKKNEIKDAIKTQKPAPVGFAPDKFHLVIR
jgi:hypothetical protein